MDLIPLDKSWCIRNGFLDLLEDRGERVSTFLDTEIGLSDDLVALRRIVDAWPRAAALNVGESGTLYRFLRFAAWARGEDREFIRGGTLRTRAICDNPQIVNWSLERLLTLDSGTSQWASAAFLVSGGGELPENPPHKLLLSAEALAERGADGVWLPREDTTIKRQFAALPGLLAGVRTFCALHSEDYMLARAFDLIDVVEGERRFPQLRGHESDRLAAMETGLVALPVIASPDHRVIQALAARARADGLVSKVVHPQAVSKSWPRFWEALDVAHEKSLS